MPQLLCSGATTTQGSSGAQSFIQFDIKLDHIEELLRDILLAALEKQSRRMSKG